MGFALTLGSIKDNVSSDQDETALIQLLQRRQINYVEKLELDQVADEFFEVSDDVDDDGEEVSPYVAGPELFWSSWLLVQNYLVALLGRDRVPTALFIHAWYGVAVPGDIENTLLGEPYLRKPQTKKKGLLERIGLGKKSSDDQVGQRIAQMIDKYAGPYENLAVVSGPRLLSELEAGIEAAGIGSMDFMSVYQEILDSDDARGPAVSLLIYHKFLKAGLAGKHLVWWRK